MLMANWSSSLTLACLLVTMPAACASAKPQLDKQPSSNASSRAHLVHEFVVLAHANAQQTAQHMHNAMHQRGVRIDVDTRVNRLIVTGAPADVTAACELIARLDTPTPAPEIKP